MISTPFALESHSAGKIANPDIGIMKPLEKAPLMDDAYYSFGTDTIWMTQDTKHTMMTLFRSDTCSGYSKTYWYEGEGENT